jgi:hypothetical protein
MAESIFVVSLLIVFLVRDVQLLTTRAQWPLGTRLLAYAFAKLVSIAGFLLLCPASANGVFAATLRSPLVWPASVTLHALCWLACLWILRGRRRNAWIIALLPSPILLLSLICIASTLYGRAGMNSSAIMALCWILLVSTLAFATNRSLREEKECEFIVEFAGFSNLTALAAIPVVLIPA